MAGSASKKRPRQSEEQCLDCAKRKKHLYLAVYESKGGFVALAIHKLDADNMPEEDALPEPAVRIAAPERAPMAVTAAGTSIFVATSPHLTEGRPSNQEEAPPPTLVYDTETAALTIGPHLLNGYLDGDAGVPTAVGEKLYALTKVYDEELLQHSYSLRVLSRTRTRSSFIHSERIMEWSWNGRARQPPPPPPALGRSLMVSWAVHPDGRTIFMSTISFTWSFDTGKRVWKELGFWSLPFAGQAFFDGDLDAWVGLHSEEEGYLCCCKVPSRSGRAAVGPECKMLKEKMFFRSDKYANTNRRHQKATLTYMGDGRFCLAENVLNSRNSYDGMLNVTLFGLRYDSNGELCTKVRRTTRSYATTLNGSLFPHAAFWM